LLFIDPEAGANTSDNRIRIGVWRESIKFEALASVDDMAVHRFELVALEWAIRIDIPVEEVDDNALLLDAADRKLIVGKWRDQRRILGQLI
jgi:hypothetical protein